MQQDRRANLLMGGAAIATYLGITKRQVFHLHDQKRLPTFSIGRTVCVRKSDLDEWLERQVRAATEAGHDE